MPGLTSTVEDNSIHRKKWVFYNSQLTLPIVPKATQVRLVLAPGLHFDLDVHFPGEKSGPFSHFGNCIKVKAHWEPGTQSIFVIFKFRDCYGHRQHVQHYRITVTTSPPSKKGLPGQKGNGNNSGKNNGNGKK
jgi:hypothetical protein